MVETLPYRTEQPELCEDSLQSLASERWKYAWK